MMHIDHLSVPLQQIQDPLIADFGVTLFIKREDLIHPQISGNKWWKLKYNLIKAKELKYDTLLTFGGAYSNHILATAFAGKEYGFKTIGIIRGEEHSELNDTLKLATKYGMQLSYIDRTRYREKDHLQFIDQLKEKFGSFYLLPEGGSNELAVKGCMEIMEDVNLEYDYICCACGTGATLAGLILGVPISKKIIGFSSLKGGQFLEKKIEKYLDIFDRKTNFEIKKNWEVNPDYHFGGYAKTTKEFFDFIHSFTDRTNIPLDYIYTGKMMFGIYRLIANRFFKKGDRIIVIHTGGLQGNAGMRGKVWSSSN